jgi:hypothetical protein
MGAPKVVDTSKAQAKVEKKKLAAQRSADTFEDGLYKKQTELTNQGLEATLNIGKKQNEISKIGLGQLDDETEILSSFFGSIDKLNEDRRNRARVSLSNIDSLFSVVNPPVSANFDVLQDFILKTSSSPETGG